MSEARNNRRNRKTTKQVVASKQNVVQQARLLDSAGTAWHAVKYGNLEMITKLFPSQCNVYNKGPVGDNVFHVAMILNTPSTLAIARYLVKLYGKTLVNTPYQERKTVDDPPGSYEGETAVHIAIVNRDFDMVKFLVQNGADVRVRAYGQFFQPGSAVYYGEFPLSFAACTGQKDIVSYLKRHGARVNHDRDTSGNTALHLCVYHDQPEMYDHLVEYCGASESVRNNSGFTPMLLAASLGKQEMFQHIYSKRRKVAWAYGPVTSYSLCLREIDTVQNPGEYVPSAIETIIHKGHKNMLGDLLLIELLQTKWRRFAAFEFVLQGSLYVVMVTLQTFLIWQYCSLSGWNQVPRVALEYVSLAFAVFFFGLELLDFYAWLAHVYQRRTLMKASMKYRPPLYPIPGDTIPVQADRPTRNLFNRLGLSGGLSDRGSKRSTRPSSSTTPNPPAAVAEGLEHPVELDVEQGNQVAAQFDGDFDCDDMVAGPCSPVLGEGNEGELADRPSDQFQSAVSAEESADSLNNAKNHTLTQLVVPTSGNPSESANSERYSECSFWSDRTSAQSSESFHAPVSPHLSHDQYLQAPGASARVCGVVLSPVHSNSSSLTFDRTMSTMPAFSSYAVPSMQQLLLAAYEAAARQSQSTAVPCQRGELLGRPPVRHYLQLPDVTRTCGPQAVCEGTEGNGSTTPPRSLSPPPGQPQVAVALNPHVQSTGTLGNPSRLAQMTIGTPQPTPAPANTARGGFTADARPPAHFNETLSRFAMQGATSPNQSFSMPGDIVSVGLAALGPQQRAAMALTAPRLQAPPVPSAILPSISPRTPNIAPPPWESDQYNPSGRYFGEVSSPVVTSDKGNASLMSGALPQLPPSLATAMMSNGQPVRMSHGEGVAVQPVRTTSMEVGPEGVGALEANSEYKNRARRRGVGGDLPYTREVKRLPSRTSRPNHLDKVTPAATGGAAPNDDAPATPGTDDRPPLDTGSVMGTTRTILHASRGYLIRQLHDPITMVSLLHLLLTFIHFITWQVTYGMVNGSGPAQVGVRVFDDIIVALMGLTGWLALIYFARGHPATGRLSVILEHAVLDVINFAIFYFLANIGFTLAFYTLNKGTTYVTGAKPDDGMDPYPAADSAFKNIGIGMIQLVRFMYGEAEFGPYTNTGFTAKKAFATMLWLLYVAVVLLLMCNMLVAMVVTTHKLLQGESDLIWRLRWAAYIVRCEKRLPSSLLQRYRLGQLSFDGTQNTRVYNHVFEVVEEQTTASAALADARDKEGDQHYRALEALLDQMKKGRKK